MTLIAPRDKTKKRLFAVSGNRCYFPNCNTPLVDLESVTVTGEICHIKGKKPESPRYDPNQSDEEIHGFDNLILMCGFHHKVIDDDPDSYTVSRLEDIKKSHEQSNFGGKEHSDTITNLFIDNVTDGSIIYTQDQRGGQVAHSIINIGYNLDNNFILNLFNELFQFLEELFTKEQINIDYIKSILHLIDMNEKDFHNYISVHRNKTTPTSVQNFFFLNGKYRIHFVYNKRPRIKITEGDTSEWIDSSIDSEKSKEVFELLKKEVMIHIQNNMKEKGIVKGKIPESAFFSRKSASEKSFTQRESESYKKMEDYYINALTKEGQKILNKLLKKKPGDPKLKLFLAINDFMEITKVKTEARAIEALNSFLQNLESYRKYLEILRADGNKDKIKEEFLKFFNVLNDKFIWSEDVFKKSKIALNYFLYLFINYYLELEPIKLLGFIQEIRKFRLKRFSLTILDHFTGIYHLLREDYSNAEKFFINQVTRFTDFKGHEPYLEIAFKINKFNFMNIGINTFVYLLILVILQDKDLNLKRIKIIKNGIEGSNYKRYDNYGSQFKKEFIVQKELIIEQLKYFRDNFDLFRVKLDKVNEQLDRIYEKEFKEETFNMVDIEDLTDLEED